MKNMIARAIGTQRNNSGVPDYDINRCVISSMFYGRDNHNK